MRRLNLSLIIVLPALRVIVCGHLLNLLVLRWWLLIVLPNTNLVVCLSRVQIIRWSNQSNWIRNLVLSRCLTWEWLLTILKVFCLWLKVHLLGISIELILRLKILLLVYVPNVILHWGYSNLILHIRLRHPKCVNILYHWFPSIIEILHYRTSSWVVIRNFFCRLKSVFKIPVWSH